jgi:hypothetical protein
VPQTSACGILPLPQGNGEGEDELKRRRRKVEHTDDWQELLPLFGWPEQEAYEELRRS